MKQSSKLSTLRNYHVGDVTCIIIVALIYYIYTLYSVDNQMVVPTNASSSALNDNYLFPIKLNGLTCYSNDLANCDNSSTSDCCKAALSEGVSPHETVNETILFTLCPLLPLVMIIFRSFLWSKLLQTYSSLDSNDNDSETSNSQRNVISSPSSPRRSTFPTSFWIQLTWEHIIGLIISILFTIFVTDFFKAMIGSPRPIYYALINFSTKVPHIESRIKYFNTAHRSFPSGHSSISMASFGYTAFLWFKDAEILTNRAVFLSRILFLISFLLIFLALWVGATRIIDYWHHYWDVIAGFLIGISWALVSYRFIHTYNNTKSFIKYQKSVFSPNGLNETNFLYPNTSNSKITYNKLLNNAFHNTTTQIDDFESGFVWTPEKHGTVLPNNSINNSNTNNNDDNSTGLKNSLLPTRTYSTSTNQRITPRKNMSNNAMNYVDEGEIKV